MAGSDQYTITFSLHPTKMVGLIVSFSPQNSDYTCTPLCECLQDYILFRSQNHHLYLFSTKWCHLMAISGFLSSLCEISLWFHIRDCCYEDDWLHILHSYHMIIIPSLSRGWISYDILRSVSVTRYLCPNSVFASFDPSKAKCFTGVQPLLRMQHLNWDTAL